MGATTDSDVKRVQFTFSLSFRFEELNTSYEYSLKHEIILRNLPLISSTRECFTWHVLHMQSKYTMHASRAVETQLLQFSRQAQVC